MNKKIMLKKVYKDIIFPLKYDINPDQNFTTLNNLQYYLYFDEDILKSKSRFEFKFDSNQIPKTTTVVRNDVKLYYNPTGISFYALCVYQSYLESKEAKDKKRFLNLADWFLENQNDKGYWIIPIEQPNFGLLPPWESAMTQGRGISILIRAYYLTDNKKYINSSLRALETFNHLVEEGGIKNFYKGSPFYEEYPTSQGSHVLNGMIFALFGVYDLIRIEPDNKMAIQIFEEGIRSLEKMVPLYDVGNWCSYDLSHLTNINHPINPCTVHYMNIHIKQLFCLYLITKIDIFKRYSDKWKKNERNKINQIRAYYKKYFFLKKSIPFQA